MKERAIAEKVRLPCEHCFRKGFVIKHTKCPEKSHLDCKCLNGTLQVKTTCPKCWGGGYTISFRKQAKAAN